MKELAVAIQNEKVNIQVKRYKKNGLRIMILLKIQYAIYKDYITKKNEKFVIQKIILRKIVNIRNIKVSYRQNVEN